MSFFVNYTTKPEKSQEVKLEIFPKKEKWRSVPDGF
jgi:hypothetical protein